MTFWTWDPFEEMRRLQSEMERVFRNFGSERLLLEGKAPKDKEVAPWHGFRMPVADMYETDKNIVAEFELPGVDKKNIELNVTDDAVEVKVQQKAEVKEEKKGFYRYESRSHQFFRRLPLPEGVDTSNADATFKEDILKVEIPKTENALQKAKRLEIK